MKMISIYLVILAWLTFPMFVFLRQEETSKICDVWSALLSYWYN